MKYLATGVIIWGDCMKIKDIVAKDILVECSSKKECEDFLALVEEEGISWTSGVPPTRVSYWSLHSREVIFYHIVYRISDNNISLKYVDYISPELAAWEIIPAKAFFFDRESKINILSFLEEAYTNA